MKITIFGAGAIGGYLAAKLALAGRTDLSIVARGAHLEAIQANGLRLIEDGEESVAPFGISSRKTSLRGTLKSARRPEAKSRISRSLA